MITYTFAANCGIAQLAGVTVTGGKFDEMIIGGRKEIIVRFATIIAGKRVIAKIAGKPELEALYREHLAGEARKAAILHQIGWPAYQAIQAKCINARAAYDAASMHGYPMREAAAAKLAEAALEQARLDYPGAAAYALAESYRYAANDRKSSAGEAAIEAIEAGMDPQAAVAQMQERWSAAAMEAIND